MSSWQDQPRGGSGTTATDPAGVAASGRPMSRREAREAERRAAEAAGGGTAHPSGIVDPYSPRPAGGATAEQDFANANTTDIWAELAHRSQQPEPPERPRNEDLSAFRSGIPAAVPSAAVPPHQPDSAVPGDLLDRVREAVLKREREAQGSVPSSAHPAQSHRDLTRALTRRELRQRQDPAGETGAYHDEADPFVPSLPEAYAPAPSGFPGTAPSYAFGSDGFGAAEEEPYRPEPTARIAMPVPSPPSPGTNPVGLPQFFVEPAGDDAITFSSPIPTAIGEPADERPAAAPDASFLEPRHPWFETPAQGIPIPTARPATPFLHREPESPLPQAFVNPELGPPSEVTDLAGFEALIRKARAQPAAPAPQPAVAAEARAALPWADDEDLQDGFTGLLSRSVQGSNGSANALILPSDPQPDLTQAVNSTGDLFVTGSMKLSRNLSTTGATASHYDAIDVDRLFEASQDEPAAGVEPVRASRAVSGTGSNRAIVAARRSPGTVLPTVLAIVAGAMAVGVVGLLVFSWISNVI